jgi:hypothetical protein
MTSPATFNNSYRIICNAMDNAGLLEQGDEPNSEQLAKYQTRLNDYINFLQTQGLKLWLQFDQAIPLVANKATYTMTLSGDINITKPLRCLQGYYLDTNSIRRPIYPMSRDEYLTLSEPLQTGQLNSYFVDKQQNQLAVTFWCVPDANAALGTAHLLIQNQVTNLISLTDAMNFPQEWFIALHWGLAAEICTGQPPAIVSRCEERATFYMAALEGWDVEDASTRFSPDPQSLVTSRFR